MPKSLPPRPNLEQLKNQAKELQQSLQSGDPSALQRFVESHPRGASTLTAPVGGSSFSLTDAQLVVAREYGFASWPKLKTHVEELLLDSTDPMELLKQAFQADNASLFRRLLERYPEARARISEPIAPFDSPVITQVRSREMLDVLLEAGADLNAKSRWWAGGFGLLHNADRELAEYAIERGALVDVHAAARLGMMERLRELLSADPALLHARGGDGQTPLHFASTLEGAEFLVDRGADLNARDLDHESTPAQHMVKDRQEIARYLVRRGCQTDLLMAAALGDAELVRKHVQEAPDCVRIRVSEEYFPMINRHSGGIIYQWTLGWHISPHEVAKKFGHDAIYQWLLEHSPAEVRLIVACWTADEHTATATLNHHPGLVAGLAQVDRRQVAHAARNNNSGAVRLMLKAGLPVDALGQHRATPLHWAAFHGNTRMVQDIFRYHPPLELADADFNSTPLGWAIHGSEHGWHCRSGDYGGTVRLLIDAGAQRPVGATGGTAAVRAALGTH